MIQKKVESRYQFLGYEVFIETKWLKGPIGKISVENSLLVFVANSKGEVVSLPQDLHVEFYSTMPSMGHPLEDAGYFEVLETGLYINRHIVYNMPGRWKQEVWLVDSSGNIVSKVEWYESF
ncbi:MAG: hypothetical protein KDD61_11475 [Bdellovibrionales bacterium]|nr:hypothetical protein [Bdellovibrionales bacterium]